MKRAALFLLGCVLGNPRTRCRASTRCARAGAAPTGCCSPATANRCSARASTQPSGAATGSRLQDVSPALREAIVVSEDKRFYEHSGVDWRGAAAAAWANLWNTRTRGASTVTMQLTGLIDDRSPAGAQSIGEKAPQTVGALWLDHAWRKDQILEAYLNLVPFRGEIVGLSALSQTLFGKAPSGLERARSGAGRRARARTERELREGRGAGLRDSARHGGRGHGHGLRESRQLRATDAHAHRIGSPRSSDYDALAPHFARRIADEVHPAAGARVRSTLDASLQRFARDTLARTLLELNARAHQRNVHDGAAIVLDNRTGEVLAWVGSAGGLSNAPEVDAVLACVRPARRSSRSCTRRPSTKNVSRRPPCSTTPRSISPPAAACISRKTTTTISRAG